jgi:hypothetical protein
LQAEAPSLRAPKLGEVVQVRSRTWLVEDVTEPAVSGQTPIVRLACADDDNQGQVLEVFWDYELDRRIVERRQEGTDRLRFVQLRLRPGLNAVASAATSSTFRRLRSMKIVALTRSRHATGPRRIARMCRV